MVVDTVDKYVLKSSRIPLLIFWASQFVVWFPISLYAFIAKDAVFFFSMCCVILGGFLLLVFMYKPTIQLVANKEVLLLPTRIQRILWKDIEKINLWVHWGGHCRDFLFTHIDIVLKSGKRKKLWLFGIKENTAEIEHILQGFLAQSK